MRLLALVSMALTGLAVARLLFELVMFSLLGPGF